MGKIVASSNLLTEKKLLLNQNLQIRGCSFGLLNRQNLEKHIFAKTNGFLSNAIS